MDDKLEVQVEKVKPDYFASQIDREFLDAKTARLEQEKIFLRAHYNIKGVYDPKYDFQNGTSHAFVQVTAPRVQTATSMIIPVLMPPGDQPYTIDATPKENITPLAAQLAQEGAEPSQIEEAIRKEAEARADRLSVYVEDGFVEAGFATKLPEIVLDAATYGTGICAGPFAVESKPNSGTEEALNALMSLDEDEEKYSPEIEYVSPWDFYPDPSARTIEDCGYIIHRQQMSVAKLRSIRNTPGFDTDAIDEVLNNNPEGNCQLEWWETEQDEINSKNQTYTGKGKFICLVRWGFISGRDLINAGHDVPDNLVNEQVMAAIWKIDHKVISVRVSKLHKNRIPFYAVPYRKVPNSLWGVGIPEMMFDSQDAINAIERAKMDLMALLCRPQVTVFPERIHPSTNVIEMKGGKIWAALDSEVVGGNNDPVRFWTPQNSLNELLACQRDHFQFIQEQTGIPNALMGMGGQGTHNRTAEGATLQFNAAATALKSVIYNFENYLIVPLTTSMAKFYQMFSDDPKIMGDYKVNARGLQGLMARENLVGDLLQLMQVAGTVPQWAKKLSFDRVWELFIRAKGLTTQTVTIPDEVLAQQEMLAQQAQQEQQLAMEQEQMAMQNKQRAETAPKDALIEAMKQAPDSGPLKLDLIGTVLETYGMLNEQLAEALETQKTLESHKMLTESEKLGAEAASQRLDININPAGKKKKFKVERDETGAVTGMIPEEVD